MKQRRYSDDFELDPAEEPDWDFNYWLHGAGKPPLKRRQKSK